MATVQALRLMPPHLLLPVLISLAGVVLVAVKSLRARESRNRVRVSRLAKAFFGISVVSVLAVTLLDGATPTSPEWRSLNLVPGETIAGQWHNLSRSTGLLNIAGNVVLFSPVAYFLRLGWRSNSLLIMGLNRPGSPGGC